MNREDLEKAIIQIVQSQLPGKSIKTVEDKGVWLKKIFKITFEDDSNIYIKLAVRDFTDVLMESNVVDLLRKNEIHQPGVIKIDTSCTKLPYPFIIQDGGTGKPLSYYLARNDTDQLKHIYHAIGKYYSKYADIANDWAGVWDVIPEKKKYPLHPAEAMYQLEIEQGSGHKAYTTGAITPEQYEKIKTVWHNNISLMKESPVCLVHYSPFPWTIYISETGYSYQVSKITALGDIIWWDADIMAAHVLYPPFFTIDEDLRRAFLDGYKKDINKKCVSLYCIMHRLCAWAGIYEEPDFETNSLWRQSCISDINILMEDI